MKKFSLLENFKYTNEEIEDFFIDYIDAGNFKLTNGFVDDDNTFFTDVANVDKKTRECKRIEITIEEIANGVHDKTGGRGLTDIKILSDMLDKINLFYTRSGEKPNFIIKPIHDDIEIIFFLIGGSVEESHLGTKDEIKNLLNELVTIFKKRTNYRGISLKGNNFFEIKTPKTGGGFMGHAYSQAEVIRKAIAGTLPNNERNEPLIQWINKATHMNYDIQVNSYDYQVVVSLKKR